jgi:sulfate adenylyltransferase subunit 1
MKRPMSLASLHVCPPSTVALDRPVSKLGSPQPPTHPRLAAQLDATLAWLADKPLRHNARVLVKHGTRTVPAIVTSLVSRFDEQQLSTVANPENLRLNEIGRVLLHTAEPLPVDDYGVNRRTGAFLMIDPNDGTTLAAGLIGTNPLT